jgi:large subunit ribosomal protein L25
MKFLTVHFENRPERMTGGELRALRQSGKLPAILSRAGREPLPLAVSTEELRQAVRHSGVGGIVVLRKSGDGEEHLGMLKELQWDPLSRRLLHVAFQEVSGSQVVTTRVPLIFVGEPLPVTQRTGQLIKTAESVEVHGRVQDLPDHIAVDISGLRVGDVVTAGDLILPEGCEPAHPTTVLCSVSTPTVVTEEAVVVEAPLPAGEVEEKEEEA